MLVQKTKLGLIPWNGEPISGTQHPRNIEELWSDEELAKWELYRVKEGPIPDGKMATDWTVQDSKNGPVRVPTLIDIPPPVPTLDDRLRKIEEKLGL